MGFFKALAVGCGALVLWSGWNHKGTHMLVWAALAGVCYLAGRDWDRKPAA